MKRRAGRPTPRQAANEARIRALTEERDELLAKLGQANQELPGRKRQDAAPQISELTAEVNALRARLAVDEAEVIPYTPEELVLFRQPTPEPASPDAGKKSIRELPGGAASLVAEAQRNFSARQYDKAEDDYREILRRDENNGLALGNLAAIELEQNKLDDAEKHITRRSRKIRTTPTTFDSRLPQIPPGKIRRRAQRLEPRGQTRSAKSRNPKLSRRDAEPQGLRGQAETALRKAIQLDPNYGAAHNNLAVIYISQQPPLVGLARWHYQKALDRRPAAQPGIWKRCWTNGARP